MTGTAPALIATAAAVGFGHAILPDHWVPLAVVGRTRRYTLARVARLSGLAGIAHVLVSILLGGLVIAVGLELRSTIQSAQDTIVGLVLILTGVAFVIFELSGRGHSHGHDHGHQHAHDDHGGQHAHDDHGGQHAHGHDHGHQHAHGEHDDPDAHQHDRRQSRLRGLAGIMVPFGAAASPDLTILPVFLAASATGTGAAIGSLLAFAVVTIATIVALTLLATVGGYQLRGRWLDRWGNAITAVTLLVIGTLVFTGVI